MKEMNYSAKFIELASEINTNMPRYVVARVLDALNDRGKTLKGNKVLVLGVAYKPDIEDVRESPAFDVIALMRKKGALVEYHDPFVPHIHHEHEGWKMDSIAEGELMREVAEADAVVIITDHHSYDYSSILEKAQFIFDSRNALGKLNRENPKVVRL
jgi:UDP-N-acetyl-D-glucosamine dehydrogenase